MHSGKKRDEERGEEITDVSKRNKHQFNVDDFISEILGDYFDSEDENVVEFIDKVEQIATLVADAAVVNNFDDDTAIEYIIMKFATSHLKHYKIFLPDPDDRNSSSATPKEVLIHQLEKRTHESLIRMGTLVEYLTTYKEHNSLSGIFAEFKHGKTSNINEFIINLLSLVKDTYEDHGSIPPKYFVDYLSIEQFLANKPLIESYLDELEKLLQQHVAAKNITELEVRKDGKLMLPASQPHKRYKILSDVICAWSKENGFTAQAKIINLLSHRNFLGLLSSLTLLKDNAVNAGEYHGAWSHAIQWFCIIEHNKRTGFLRNEPRQLYKSAGPIWNKVFDLLGDVDFTCPPHMTRRMYRPDALDKWPLLAGSITRIYNKMHLSGMDYTKHLRDKCGEEAYAKGYQVRRL